MKRRKFIKNLGITGAATSLMGSTSCHHTKGINKPASVSHTLAKPLVLATWNVPNAVKSAYEILKTGGSALDAVEQGCRVEEADVNNQSVGKGGRPDREGHVTLDACIMNEHGDCGSVVYMKNITHAVTVARMVMEKTPHVMLAGLGAEEYAVSQGLPREELLTESGRKGWQEWLKESEYKPIINIENHDTIGMIAMDMQGNLSGACTTSGMAYKMAGRVGDSPIIGSGLYVDNEVGACTATGMGEEVIKTVGSFLVVELMRQGMHPQKACEEAIHRIVHKPDSRFKDFQVGYIAMNKAGDIGSYAIHQWFSRTVGHAEKIENIQSDFYWSGE